MVKAALYCLINCVFPLTIVKCTRWHYVRILTAAAPDANSRDNEQSRRHPGMGKYFVITSITQAFLQTLQHFMNPKFTITVCKQYILSV